MRLRKGPYILHRDVDLEMPQLRGLSIQYNYPSTGNNGKVSSQTDNVSGETVTYTYDALNRLITAANQSTFTPEWGQSFTYDGFGNLTNVSVTQGSAPTLSAIYDANNHAGGEDANGNPGYVPLPAYGTSVPAGYDVENRLVSGPAYYSYAPGNQRVWRGSWTTTYSDGSYIYTRGTDEITFWSVSGQKLGDYALTTISGLPSEPQFYATETECNYYFGSKLIKNINGWVYSDRLASIGKFYPYGIQRPSATANGTEKFTGYFRDSESGNDYADQRYTSPGMGRFITPDRMTGNPGNPGSWNKYAYTSGDPINNIDPGGNYDCTVGVGDYAETTDCEDVTVYAGPANPQCMLLLQAASGSPANPVAQEQYETYCTQVGGPSPTPAPAPQPTPQCSISLYERGAGSKNAPWKHTYIVVDDSQLTSGPEIIQAGPSNNFPAFGTLMAQVVPPGVGFGSNKNNASDPAAPGNQEIGSPYTGVYACSDILAMLYDVSLYQSRPQVPYLAVPIPFTGTYNSNSFTYTLLDDVGLSFGWPGLPLGGDSYCCTWLIASDGSNHVRATAFGSGGCGWTIANCARAATRGRSRSGAALCSGLLRSGPSLREHAEAGRVSGWSGGVRHTIALWSWICRVQPRWNGALCSEIRSGGTQHGPVPGRVQSCARQPGARLSWAVSDLWDWGLADQNRRLGGIPA